MGIERIFNKSKAKGKTPKPSNPTRPVTEEPAVVPASSSRAREPERSSSRATGTSPLAAPAGPAPVVALTHDEIAALAYELWLGQGCPQGHEDENWRHR